MADHRSRTRPASSGPAAVWVLRLLLLSGLALLAPRPAPALDSGEQAQAQSLGEAFGRTALDASASTFLLQSGQISQLAYRDRLTYDRAQLKRLQQSLARLSPQEQAVARQQAQATFNQGMAVLQRRIAQWRQQGQSSGRPRAGASAARPYVPPPPPAPYVPPAPSTSSRQSSGFERLLVLLLIGGGVAGCAVVIARRRRAGSPALPPEAEEIPARSIAPPSSLPADPGSLPAVPASGSVAPRPAAIASAAPATGDAKERLLAEQTAKYQATLAAAMDELTATQVALEERKTVPDLIRKDLGRVGELVYERVRKLLREQASGTGKMVLHALLLLPLWRRFRRAGIGLKILMAIGAWWVLGAIGRLWAAGFHLAPIFLYFLVAVPLCFYFERRAQTRGTVKELEGNAASLQHPTLLHVYPDQAPGPIWLLRFWSAAGKAACDETQVNLPNMDSSTAAGARLLSFGDMATYRIAADADPVLAGSKPNAFMNAHGALLQTAVSGCRNDLVPILKHASLYGQLKWRERRQKGEIPRLEALLGNVKRLADIWAPVYVSDKVFEFLIRRVDLFNLRDRATPAGILLHGYPGNGKEFLAQMVAHSVFATFIKASADQLSSAKDVKAFWASQDRKSVV